MVDSQHDKSDHEEGDELPEDLEISDDLRIHLMSIKGANKKLGTRVEELSANIVGVEDGLNERLTASDRQRTDSLQVVTEPALRSSSAPSGERCGTPTPRRRRDRDNDDDGDFSEDSDARGGLPHRPRHDVGAHRHAGRRHDYGGNGAHEDDGLGRIKITIPEFSGRCADPEKYLEWEMRVNQIFDGHNYSEEKRVRVASMKFTEYALVWWDNKNCTHERPATWTDMKRIMREHFVPAYYTRQLHSRLRRLVQGRKSVDEYYKEMQVLMIRTAVRLRRQPWYVSLRG